MYIYIYHIYYIYYIYIIYIYYIYRYMIYIYIYIYIYKWANALVPPTPIWRAMVIRCYAMLSYMFPYLSCLSMIFTRILGNSPEQPPIRIITLFPCRGLVNPEHDPWKSRPKTPPSFAYPLNGVWRHGQALAQGCRTNPRQA